MYAYLYSLNNDLLLPPLLSWPPLLLPPLVVGRRLLVRGPAVVTVVQEPGVPLGLKLLLADQMASGGQQ